MKLPSLATTTTTILTSMYGLPSEVYEPPSSTSASALTFASVLSSHISTTASTPLSAHSNLDNTHTHIFSRRDLHLLTGPPPHCTHPPFDGPDCITWIETVKSNEHLSRNLSAAWSAPNTPGWLLELESYVNNLPDADGDDNDNDIATFNLGSSGDSTGVFSALTPDLALPALNLNLNLTPNTKSSLTKRKKNCPKAGMITCCANVWWILPIACCVVCNKDKPPKPCKYGQNIFGCEGPH
ncbi:hypothetical protein OHC33_007778 [Knufia fluminis]|uniref:Uncharacterized protein n=1 Tax=Knufia fluminis TaxID=191047 RepID=A0AAN8ECP4_9EURO|nr:hypothetical protein OHC33_007778 [Knufia fluminis]